MQYIFTHSSQMKIPVIAHLLAMICNVQGGYAPRESPKLPDGFCPKETGTITETTGGKEELRSHFYCVYDLSLILDIILQNACAIGSTKMVV